MSSSPYTVDQFEDSVDSLFLQFFEAMRFSSTVKSFPLTEDIDPGHADKILSLFSSSYTSLNHLQSIGETEQQLNEEILSLNEKINQKKKDIQKKKEILLQLKYGLEDVVLKDLTDESLGLY